MKYVLICIALVFMIGCGSSEEEKAHKRQMELLKMEQSHERSMMRQNSGATVIRQNSGPSYLETMAIAGAAGYIATKFIPQYEVSQSNGNYYDKHGVSIAKTEYDRRSVQSAKDKAAYKERESKKLSQWKSNNAQKYIQAQKKYVKKQPSQGSATLNRSRSSGTTGTVAGSAVKVGGSTKQTSSPKPPKPIMTLACPRGQKSNSSKTACMKVKAKPCYYDKKKKKTICPK